MKNQRLGFSLLTFLNPCFKVFFDVKRFYNARPHIQYEGVFMY